MPLRERRIAVVGASGQVGRMLLNLLAERHVPFSNIVGMASNKSHGRKISYGDDDVVELSALNHHIQWSDFDIVFFAAGSKISAEWAPKAIEAGCFVVDKSSFFRLCSDIPLVVPEVNAKEIFCAHKGLVSNPNCVAIPLLVVLNALQHYGEREIESVTVSTYQSVSGAGQAGMMALDRQTGRHHMNILMQKQGVHDDASPFMRPIAFNVIPHIDVMNPETGSTGEEEKIAQEIKKILDIPVCVTCVRVPVFVGHSMSVHIQFKKPITVSAARTALEQESAIELDGPHTYTTPVECSNTDEIHVSRVRNDGLSPKGLMLWIACDNLRKGAALNAIQIAEYYSLGGVHGISSDNS